MFLRSLIKIALLIFIITFKFVSTSIAKDISLEDSIEPFCKGKNPEIFFNDQEIKKIEILTNNKRAWFRNLMNALVKFNTNKSKSVHKDWFTFRINDAFKERFDSKVKVFFGNNITCVFNGKIRMTGDLWWHLDWKTGKPLSSVHVKLSDGNVNSITEFKLFLPKSRNFNNEIFVSNILKELGYLAPTTFNTLASINGIESSYIFQEDLKKELLEDNGYREGPILEGDERFTIMLQEKDMKPEITFSRLSNKNYSIKSITNQKISVQAVSNLNKVYLQHHQIEKNNLKIAPADKLNINLVKFNEMLGGHKNLATYEALMYALDSAHNLSFDDRRFYYNPITNEFLPIYYDGKSKILEDKQSGDLNILSKSVSKEAKRGAEGAILLLENLDHEKVIAKLNNAGFRISNEEFKKILEKIIKRLKIIQTSKTAGVKYLETTQYFPDLKKDISKNRKLIFIDENNDLLKICSFNLIECNNLSLHENINLVPDIISQRYNDIKDNEHLFISNEFEFSNEDKFQKNKIFKVKTTDNFKIKYNKYINYEVNEKTRKIKITQLNNQGRIVFYDGKLNNWEIEFNGFKKVDNVSDHYGLTGCVTLYNVNIKNSSFKIKNSFCEDAINFIRTNGNIKNIEIINSISDALDVDFSNLILNKVEILSAKNDCSDFSFGKYEILQINTRNCGDKGISVGEKSDLNIGKSFIDKSNIGVAVKDSSYTKIQSSKQINTNTCFAAYRKKQEFVGGYLKVKNTNCNKDSYVEQIGSKIYLN